MKCPNCGKEIADDSRYCEFCGTKISKPKSIKVLWVMLAVLLGLSALSAILYYVYDAHWQHVKEVAEAKAAQEEAERQAEEALRLAEEAKEQAQYRRKEAERRAKLKAQGWIDLGLPSGTLWKDRNENCGLITYDDAYKLYGSHLPTKEQFQELKDHCFWTWQGNDYRVKGTNGYRVKGTSGESIFLPAAGFRYCDGSTNFVGTNGYYWSSTPYGLEFACVLGFCSSEVYVYDSKRCSGRSVRLVR